MLLRNSGGKKDGMYTFAVLGLLTTITAVVLSTVESISAGDWSMKFQSPDSTIVIALLGATVTAYVARRNKKEQLDHELELEKLKQGLLE